MCDVLPRCICICAFLYFIFSHISWFLTFLAIIPSLQSISEAMSSPLWPFLFFKPKTHICNGTEKDRKVKKDEEKESKLSLLIYRSAMCNSSETALKASHLYLDHSVTLASRWNWWNLIEGKNNLWRGKNPGETSDKRIRTRLVDPPEPLGLYKTHRTNVS
jgi:hypothetical protein